MTSFISGSLAGLAYGLLLGPLFFTGLRSTLTKGVKGGAVVFAGSFCSDFFMGTSGYFSAEWIRYWIQEPQTIYVLHLAAGFVLSLLGISILISTPEYWAPSKQEQSNDATSQSGYSMFATGFIINTMNPANWLFWGGLPAAYLNFESAFWALSGAFLNIILANIGKTYLALYLSRRLQPNRLLFFTRTAGIIFLVLGLYSISQLIIPSS